MDVLLVGGIAVALLALSFIYYFNLFVRLRNKADNCWAQVDVQLKLRYDVVPNLVEVVKAYAKQEKDVFTQVAKIRSDAMAASGVAQKGEKEVQLSNAISGLFAIAESYPKMKSDQHFLELMRQISNIEGKIAFARQFYNDAVLEYNTSTQNFPGMLVASATGFGSREYFQADDAAKKSVIVDLKK